MANGRYISLEFSKTLKKAILVVFMVLVVFHSHAPCQEIDVKQSVENANRAWELIFPGNRCVLLHQINLEYETRVYEMKYVRGDIVLTNSRVNPYRLKIRIGIESWSSSERRMVVKDALANVDEKADRLSGTGSAEFSLTGIYQLDEGRWVFLMGNKRMLNFIRSARARYNLHVDISKIISIQAK